MVKLNGKPLPKINKLQNTITISGTHLNLDAINEEKPLKADIADRYFSHLSGQAQTDAAGQLWDALKGKEVVSTDASPVIVSDTSQGFEGQ